MLISFVWLYMFKCDVYAQILDDQTQKELCVFYFFLKWFYTFVFLVFVQNAFLCFSSKNWVRGCFVRSSRLRVSREKCSREINFLTIHTETSTSVSWLTATREMLFGKNWNFPNLDRSYHGCIATVLRLTASRESFCALEVSLMSSSLLPNPRKTHVIVHFCVQ